MFTHGIFPCYRVPAKRTGAGISVRQRSTDCFAELRTSYQVEPPRAILINTAKDRKPGPLDGIQDGVLFVTTENDQRIARRLQLMKALKTEEVERALN
uniref:Uncharacterized protein n=1 Tax=Oryza rufipogon TaxID=4529 RepID=A0A0E0P970_ORYRU